MEKEEILKRINFANKNSLMETLEMSFIDIGEDFLIAKMPVNSRVSQPDGVLHGGATVALAESVGSAASYLSIDRDSQVVRGIVVSANHLKSVTEGFIYAKATPIHKGRTTQLWEIRVTDDNDNLISHCKLSTIILNKK
ncbi:MAG: PaaI family thioesterase [Flavobacteriales bacterium]|jgi:1,4-dihydroxy-2-naphthoyl-CoA hydrolase|tara:strand:+ start:4113 stop:4529 length:417 start_codon:yes stop_codon:yes gene_type:complete